MFGHLKGEKCNRDGCIGIIQEREKRSCSCHINPPCSACTEPRSYCEVCGWDAQDELPVGNKLGYKYGEFKVKEFKDLDRTKINWISLSYTHFSMIKKGVYPEGTTKEDVLEKVRGTFGGRFVKFGNGEFEYIAYTD